jgi:trehalose/maltose transport system substrate-binding protein
MAAACMQTPEHVRIALFGLGLDAGERLRRDALDDFVGRTGIRVDLIPTGGTSAEQLAQTTRFLSQQTSAPDVYVVDVIWPGTLAGHLLDLRPHAEHSASEHLPALLANDIVQGRLISLPFYLNVGMLYYRTDLLKKYGYRHPPATWDELATMAATIQQGERAGGNHDFWGYVWQGAAYEGLTCNALEWQVSFGGGRIIEPDATISVNNASTIEALRMAIRWIGTISPASVLSYTESDSLGTFQSGNAAFLRHWSAGIPPGTTMGRGHFAAAALPAGPRGRAQTMGGFHLAVSRYSAHSREAAQLVVYLTSSQVQLRRALHAGYLPTIPRLYHDPQLTHVLPYVGALKNTGAWVARPSTVAGSKYAGVSKIYYQTVHDILRHHTGIEEGVASLQQQLVDLTGFRTGGS